MSTLSLSWAGGLAAGLSLASAAFADSYHVKFSQGRDDDDGAMRRAEVVATLTPENGRIRMVRDGADLRLYNQWAGFVVSIEASDAQGRPLDLVYEPFGVWRVRGWRSGDVTVRYSMTLQHDRFPNQPGDDELAYARPYGVMWTGRALFVEGAASNDVSVAFEAPEGWRVTSPWRASDASGLRFQPDDTDDLLNSAFFAGVHAETIVRVAGMEARVAAGPDMAAEAAYYRQMLETYLPAFADFFGAPATRPPVVIMARGGFFSGGVMGRSISIVQREDPDERIGITMRDAMRHAVGHEGFHLWQVQWRINPDDNAALYWLTEGTAEYYWALISARRGAFGPDVVLNEIARHHARYLNALPGGSIAAAGRTKLDSRASYDRVYSGGFTAALALDLMIRRETGGVKSLDDVMRRVHARFGQSGAQELTPTRLVRTIRDETGLRVDRFFAAHIEGAAPFPLSDLMREVGVCLDAERGDEGWRATATRCSQITPAQEAAWAGWIGG